MDVVMVCRVMSDESKPNAVMPQGRIRLGGPAICSGDRIPAIHDHDDNVVDDTIGAPVRLESASSPRRLRRPCHSPFVIRHSSFVIRVLSFVIARPSASVNLGGMTKEAWIVACILSLAVVFGFFSFNGWQQGKEVARLHLEVRRLRELAEKTTRDNLKLRTAVEQSEEALRTLEREKDDVTQAQERLAAEMRSAIESKEITISELQGRLTVNILDRILFDSGEAVVKPEGEQILMKIAAIVAEHPNRQIHVIGHTDNVPIRASARSRFPSNWELSTARATAAVRFLHERAGVDPRRLGALGYGEFHPIADNATSEGRARNRRIALVVLPREMARAEMLPAEVQPPVSTNQVDAVETDLPERE
jgi:chemotaxis protein MotB